MVATLSPAPQKIEPRTLADLPPAPTLRDAVFLLARLTRHPAFLDAHVYPLLEGASSAEDWHVAQSHEARDGSYSLQVFVWPPGTATQIHDHASRSATSAWTTARGRATPT
jgi:predicted metal-dependent enzyme (double-stranded beta helix superfamily)